MTSRRKPRKRSTRIVRQTVPRVKYQPHKRSKKVATDPQKKEATVAWTIFEGFALGVRALADEMIEFCRRNRTGHGL